MSPLKNKTILIISPQAWGTMLISKHHYAIELARQGNRVYFLNPPGEGRTGHPSGTQSGNKRIGIHPSGIHPELFFITHTLWFPYRLKFHAIGLFHALMRYHVKKIIKAIGRVDIVWSFDLGNYYPFRFFDNVPVKIFHPVDEPLNPTAISSAAGADIIFSVTVEILEKYKQFGRPGYFINHGVSENFLSGAHGSSGKDGPVRIGFSGNLLRNDVDREIFLRIIGENPEVIFECWGSYKSNQTNIGGASNDDTKEFVESLQRQPNVILHGPVPTEILAREMRNMDAFLICYDIKKDQSGGTNYHKVMEYISTGSVVISNNVTTYASRPDLVQMVDSREDNRELPALFKKVVGSLDHFNSPELREKRLAFAADNSYVRQIERIGQILEKNL